ncbi:MAG: DUF6268 family outer membrane beta-barrel protein [Flavobacteriales bacterium]
MKKPFKSTGILLGLWVCILFNSLQLSAQTDTTKSKFPRLTKFPLFSTSYSHYPKSDLGSGEVNIEELATIMNIAFPVKPKKTYISVRFVHTYFKLNTDFNNPDYRVKENFQSFEFGGGLIKILPKRWRLVSTFSPTIASDFRNKIHNDDWIFRSNILATKRENINSSFTFGLLITTRFGKPLVLPMLGYAHKKNDWTTHILLPGFATIRKKLRNKMQVGLKMTINSNVYNADLRHYAFNNDDFNRLAFTRILLGPELLLPIYKDVYFQMTGGFSFNNIFDTQDVDLNQGINLNAKTRPFFTFGVTVLK